MHRARCACLVRAMEDVIILGVEEDLELPPVWACQSRWISPLLTLLQGLHELDPLARALADLFADPRRRALACSYRSAFVGVTDMMLRSHMYLTLVADVREGSPCTRLELARTCLAHWPPAYCTSTVQTSYAHHLVRRGADPADPFWHRVWQTQTELRHAGTPDVLPL